MASILWRVLIAVIAVLLVYALIPPVSRILGFDVSGDLFLVIKVVVAGLAVFYILRGAPPTFSRP